MKVDLHCHSKHSKRPSLWIMQRIGCPESFTEPVELYALAMQKGMNAVTITDHNVIDGCLDILHLPNTFMGCEYTTYFPEDRCKVHVLAYGFSERQHEDLSRARENIYEFTGYLNANDIRHSCAHPLFGPNDRLSMTHLEKLVLLYKNWELNGDQAPAMNDVMLRIVNALTPETIERLACKHNLMPCFEAWKKNITAGSDDHSSLHLADAYTEAPRAETLAEFWKAVERGSARIHARPASPQSFARNVYGIAYQFSKSKFGIDRHVNRDLLLRFLDRTLHTRPDTPAPQWLDRLTMSLGWIRRGRGMVGKGQPTLLSAARSEAERLIRQDPQLMAIVQNGNSHGADLDRVWYEFVNAVSNKVLMDLGGRLVERLAGARIFDLFHTIGSTGALYALVAPFFVSFSHHRDQRRFVAEALEHFVPGAAAAGERAPIRVAHFTDTFDEVNGVARTLQQQLATAQALGKDYTIITCVEQPGAARPGVEQFKAIGNIAVPEYPEIKLLTPSFLSVLEHCDRAGYTHLHISTPGPVGLVALGVAKILGLPVSGTYHTSFPQYAKALTEDSYAEEMMWKAMIWFHDQLDSVFVPSQATGNELIDKGLSSAKVRVYPRGVDIERFHPGKRETAVLARFGIGAEEIALLYVGRVSKEKNLHVLAEAYRALCARGVHARLVITGDGPYRAEMQALLAETGAVFTGYVHGEDLAALYASCSALVFPSATDTFGNVVLEAQAAGIPVIVTDQGGPAENMRQGETGLMVPAHVIEPLVEAMAQLADDADLRARMGSAGRVYIEQRAFRQAFEQLYTMYTEETGKSDDVPGAPVRFRMDLSEVAPLVHSLAS